MIFHSLSYNIQKIIKITEVILVVHKFKFIKPYSAFMVNHISSWVRNLPPRVQLFFYFKEGSSLFKVRQSRPNGVGSVFVSMVIPID